MRRKPGTYRTDAGIEVVVDVPESASWVEDQFPDEVAYLLAARPRNRDAGTVFILGMAAGALVAAIGRWALAWWLA